MRRIFRLILIAVALSIVGCDDRTTPSPAASPTTKSSPTTTAPSPTVLLIDEKSVQFPPLQLKLSKTDDGVTAVLLSQEPPGNSLFLEMDLDIDDPANIGQATWKFKAASAEVVDSPVGIFTDDGRFQLQPFDVTVNFASEDSWVYVAIEGQFVRFDTIDVNSPGTMVHVVGKSKVRLAE